jgi:tripartite-type tricarboxylate transporter receptor subunit TctC
MNRLFLLVMSVMLAVTTGPASAQSSANYPERPIRMIIPFAPGGASDFVARIIQAKLSDVLGRQVLMENRAGAAGNVGVDVVARATPDGYTVLLGNVGTMAINPSVFPKFPIKPVRDLIAVAAVADSPGAIGIHPSIPVKTINEFIAYAKSRPGALNYGSAGASSSTRLAFEYLMAKTGISLAHIPYKGGAGAATIALLGGEVQASFVSIASFIPHVKTGKLVVLAVSSERRHPSLPDVQTFPEAGFPELTASAWQGVYVPVGTPRPVVDKLHSAVLKTMQDPEVIDRLGIGGARPFLSKSPEEFSTFTKAQNEFWGKIVKQLGLEEN